MKKGQAGVMLAIFVPLIVGVIIASIVWTQVQSQQDETAVTEDEFTGSNTTCTRVTDDCYLTGTITIENGTDVTLDVNTEYVECGVGSYPYGVLVLNSTHNTKTLNASYTEIDCAYITGMTRTMINYLPILMAVVLLTFVAGFIATRG